MAESERVENDTSHFSPGEIESLTAIQAVPPSSAPAPVTQTQGGATATATATATSKPPPHRPNGKASRHNVRKALEREMQKVTEKRGRGGKPPITFSYLSTKTRSPAASISCRHEHKNSLLTPGPGAYISQDTHAIAAQHRGAPRFAKPIKDKTVPHFYAKSDTPGPHAFATPQDIGKGKGVSISAPVAYNGSVRAAVPGPASYNIPSHLGKVHGRLCGNAYSLSGRANLRSTEDPSPGPGAYTPTVGYSPAKGPSFSTRREMPNYNVSPGPGTYTYQEMGKMPGTVTIKGRTPLRLPQKGQGPPSTNYDICPPAMDPPRRSYKRTPKAIDARA